MSNAEAEKWKRKIRKTCCVQFYAKGGESTRQDTDARRAAVVKTCENTEESEDTNMRKTAITVSYDAEKLSALKVYLGQRGTRVEDELARALETIYAKTVPAGVREFLDLRASGTDHEQKILRTKSPAPHTPDGDGPVESE